MAVFEERNRLGENCSFLPQENDRYERGWRRRSFCAAESGVVDL
jgi:hypothetical protein